MAIQIKNTYSGRTDNTDTNYPYGKGRNVVGGVEGTGTPFEAQWYNNLEGFLQGLLLEAGITPDGQVDNANSSQLVEAVKGISREGLVGKIFQSPTDGGLTEIQTRTVNANEVYEVRKTSDNSLATIYSDAAGAAGATEILQNGVDNVSDSAGVVEFYIADGDYYVEINTVSANFNVITPSKLVKSFTISEVQTVGLKVGQYVRLTDRDNGLFLAQPVGLSPTGWGTIGLPSGLTLEVQNEGVAANIKHYGAKGDDSHNDSPPINEVLHNNYKLHIPVGDYLCVEELTQTRRNIISGEGQASRLLTRAGDLFRIGVAGGVSDRSVLKDIALVSAVGAGHIFLQVNQVIKYRFENLYVEQQNTDRHIYLHDSDLGNHIGNVWSGGKFIHDNAATVPAFKYVVDGTAGATNFNKWVDVELVRGSKPWFHFQSNRPNNYIYDVFLENILCEITGKGIAKCWAVNGFNVDGLTVYDLKSGGNTVSADMFTFLRGTNDSNQPSRNVNIGRYRRLDPDSALGSFVDFRCDSASGASVQSLSFTGCARNIAGKVLADISNAYDVTAQASRIDFSGTGYVNLTNYIEGGVEVKPEVLVLNGTISNHPLVTDTKLLRCVPVDTTRSLTGMIAPVHTRQVFVYNASATENLILVHNASSTAKNRFFCPSLVDLTVSPYSGVTCVYSLDVDRWIVVG
ncbi:hypothetical protein [Pseudoalteromonas phage J2-1]|uniref:Tail fiber protein n=1 Tax=Pseudoalteromonas phage J2-1 TaxID=2023998 RepID=A0A223LHV9_9CAUD|nr:hypothetical protein HOR90_gp11 [Pseudoalteromonas phage J2-1]ASU03298.1 hypothetical protein [Pseudoalteromonas phage J2-1]